MNNSPRPRDLEHPSLRAEALSNTQVRAALSRGIEPDLRHLRGLAWKRRLLEVTFFVALGVAGVATNVLAGGRPSWTIALRLAGLIATAVALNAFVLLLHEGMHNILFGNRFLNWAGSMLLGSTVFVSFTAYKVMHARHHMFLGDPRDPDDYHNYTRNRALLWLLHYVRLLSGAFLYVLLIPGLAYRHASREERRRILLEYGTLFSGYAVLFSAVPHEVLLRAWIAPLVLMGYMVNIRGFTQHGMTDAGDVLLASRTVQSGRVVAFLLLNENYHLEHHLFPEVPSYNLARLHALLWPRLSRVVIETGYLSFIARFLGATLRQDETPIGISELSENER